MRGYAPGFRVINVGPVVPNNIRDRWNKYCDIIEYLDIIGEVLHSIAHLPKALKEYGSSQVSDRSGYLDVILRLIVSSRKSLGTNQIPGV